MSIKKVTALSAAAALVIGAGILHGENNDTIPQISSEINVSIINNNIGTDVTALPPSLQLSSVVELIRIRS